MTPENILLIRTKLSLSRTAFAQLLNVGVGTLRHWERGDRKPSGAAFSLLCLIEADPKGTLQKLKDKNEEQKELID